MIRMTYDEYDFLEERFETIEHQCSEWWPSKEEMEEKIGTNVNPFVKWLIWILATNEEPITEEEKESKRYINKLLRENLKLYSKDEE